MTSDQTTSADQNSCGDSGVTAGPHSIRPQHDLGTSTADSRASTVQAKNHSYAGMNDSSLAWGGSSTASFFGDGGGGAYNNHYWRHTPQQHPRPSISPADLAGTTPAHLPDKKNEYNMKSRRGTWMRMLNDDESKRACLGQFPVSNQAAAVDSFFASIRVPASFLAATSFSELFHSYDIDDDDDSPVQQFLRTLCVVSQGFSFVLSLIVIMFSTSALTRSLAADFDPMAENGYELLFREFHYEFVSVRWSFQVSLFGFILAIAARVLHEFELFNTTAANYNRQHLEIGIAVCFLYVSLMTHLFAYVNQTLIGWNNFTDMTIDLIRILLQRGSWHKPMEWLSLTSGMVALIFLVLALIPGRQI